MLAVGVIAVQGQSPLRFWLVQVRQDLVFSHFLMNWPLDFATDPPHHSRRDLFLLGGSAVFAHVPALQAGFVLDDASLLVENPYTRTLSGLSVLLRHELFVASAQPRIVPYYRPVSGLLNWLSFQALGASAALQHALNLVLHALVTLLLFNALQSHRIRSPIAFGTALVFAAHPATAEVVAYLGGRQDMIGWLIGLGALALLRRARSLPAVASLAFGAALVGALCHEFFLALSVPLGLLAFCGEGRIARARAAAALGGGIAAVAALFVLRSWLKLVAFEAHAIVPTRLVQVLVGVLLRLLKDVVFPTDLAVDVTLTPPSLPVAILVLALSAAGTFGLTTAIWRKQRAMLGMALAGLSIAALAVGLHSGVALIHGQISDRYAYAMLVGLCLSAGPAANALVSLPTDRLALLSRVCHWGAPALATAMIPLTWSRDVAWFDEKSLQAAMIADRPHDPEAELAAGMLHLANNDLEQAYPHCQAYARARPDSEKANLCVGIWLLVHHRPVEAVTYLRPYAHARPGIERARRALVGALIASRAYAEATQTINEWSLMFQEAPDLAEARAALDPLQRPPELRSIQANPTP